MEGEHHRLQIINNYFYLWRKPIHNCFQSKIFRTGGGGGGGGWICLGSKQNISILYKKISVSKVKIKL